MSVLVTGASGFIGKHLKDYLENQEEDVRGLGRRSFQTLAIKGIEEVYHLAANMGGIGYISSNMATLMTENLELDLKLLQAAHTAKVKKFLFASSVCVYSRQLTGSLLREDDTNVSAPSDAYGWAKLTTEKLLEYYRQDYGMDVRIARLDSVYGEGSPYKGGKEKSVAALCRKVAEAKRDGLTELEIWGNGHQERSFWYIDDAVVGLNKLMRSDYSLPMNMGSDEIVTINELADIIMDAAGVQLNKKYVEGAIGIPARHSDHTLMHNALEWKPEVTLREGIAKTYAWVEQQVLDDN